MITRGTGGLTIKDESINDSIGNLPDFKDILENLRRLRIKLHNIFGVQSGSKYLSTHLFVSTHEGHEFIIMVPKAEVEDVILTFSESANIVPSVMRQHFISGLKIKTTSVCILSHLGIDVLDHPSGNVSFDAEERLLSKIGKGLRFYIPMPLVDYKFLATDEERNNLNMIVTESNDLIRFNELIGNADLDNILNGDGPYTVFAPNDATIRQAFPNAGDLDSKGFKYIRSFVLSHIIPGLFKDDFDGDVLNLNGDKVILKGGKIPGEVIDSKTKYNGKIYIMRTLLEPVRVNGDALVRKVNPRISSLDISNMTYHIWELQNKYMTTSLDSLTDQLRMMLGKVEEYRKQKTSISSGTGQKLLDNDAKIRDIYYDEDSDATKKINPLLTRISPLVEEYKKHIQTGGQLAAAEQLLQFIAKLMREA